MDQQTLFNDATYNFTEIVKKIYVRFIKADKTGKANANIDLLETSDSIKEQRHRGFGRCYTFQPEKYMRDLGIYYIKAYL